MGYLGELFEVGQRYGDGKGERRGLVLGERDRGEDREKENNGWLSMCCFWIHNERDNDWIKEVTLNPW